MPGTSGLSARRNSVAEANTATSRPADARRLDSASRTRASSSTTKTTGLLLVMARGDHASFRRGCNLKDPSDGRVLRQCACRSRRQYGERARQDLHFSKQIAMRTAGSRRAPRRSDMIHYHRTLGCRDWSVVRVGPRARRPARGPGHVAGADRPQRGPVGRGGARDPPRCAAGEGRDGRRRPLDPVRCVRAARSRRRPPDRGAGQQRRVWQLRPICRGRPGARGRRGGRRRQCRDHAGSRVPARHARPGSGGILNVASTIAFQPAPYQAVYGASKAFVLSFSEALWAEARAAGVAVTALCPGPTRTGFVDALGADVAPHRDLQPALRAGARHRGGAAGPGQRPGRGHPRRAEQSDRRRRPVHAARVAHPGRRPAAPARRARHPGHRSSFATRS